MEMLHTKVQKAIGEVAEIRSKQQKTVLECKDLDEIATKEEIYQALAGVLGLE